MEHEFNPQIVIWKRKEPNFKCLVLRFLTPVAGLLDALITLFSFTILTTNFEMEVVSLHAYEYLKSQIKAQKR